MSLAWENLSFTGDDPILKKLMRKCLCVCCWCSKKGAPIVLSNLNGFINRGQLIALMGPSGAGKSTLLKCITQGLTYSGCDGQVSIYGSTELDPTGHAFTRASFISQNEKEHLLLSLTVEQSLLYASQLRNPKMNKAEHNENVETLLTKLNIQQIRTNKVSKCSGGQTKRLAIGLELACEEKPQFLFLDEPTSGLDSFVGLEVVQVLASFAAEYNMAIVTTIHQPSLEILHKFNKVYMMAKGGNCIYCESPMLMQQYLQSYNYNYYGNENPADILIKIGSAGEIKQSADSRTIDPLQSTPVVIDQDAVICEKMAQDFQNKIKNELQTLQRQHTLQLEVQKRGLCKNGTQFSFSSLWILFKRTFFTSIWYQKKFVLIRLGLHVIVAFVIAFLYDRDMGLDDGCMQIFNGTDFSNCSCSQSSHDMKEETTTMKNVKFQFFSLLFLMFAALMPTVLTFPAEIKLFLNEHRNGWYTTVSYYASKTIVEIPLQLLFPFFYTYFLYWYSKQIGFDYWYSGLLGFMSLRYTVFLTITILSCFIAQGLGFLIGILCVRSFNITIIVSSSILLFLFLFSGFFVKTDQMSPYVGWITYISFIRFSFESIIILIYGRGRCVKPFESSVLYIFNLKDENLITNIYWLIGHLLCIRIIAFIALKKIGDPNFLKPGRILKKIVNLNITICEKSPDYLKRIGRYIFCLVKCCLILWAAQFLIGVIIAIILGVSDNNKKLYH